MGCHQFPFGFPYVGASFQKRGGQSQGKSVGQLYFFGQDVAVYGVVNATIIIFDRIRENISLMGTKQYSYKEIVNTSINQTFTRSIYTSLTTFVMVFVLYIMGVASIKEFALTLMAGIVIGAYSSVCITGPLWYFMKTKLGKKKAANE